MEARLISSTKIEGRSFSVATRDQDVSVFENNKLCSRIHFKDLVLVLLLVATTPSTLVEHSHAKIKMFYLDQARAILSFGLVAPTYVIFSEF